VSWYVKRSGALGHPGGNGKGIPKAYPSLVADQVGVHSGSDEVRAFIPVDASLGANLGSQKYKILTPIVISGSG